MVSLDVVEVGPENVDARTAKKGVKMEALLIEREGAGEHGKGESAEHEDERKPNGVDAPVMEGGGHVYGEDEDGRGKAGKKEGGDAGTQGIDKDGAVLIVVLVRLASVTDERGEEPEQGLEQKMHAARIREGETVRINGMATRVRSFAKVNLGLRIGPVREDGFHGLVTLYQTLALHDVVTVTARRAAVTRIAIRTEHPRVPTDARNTAWQMAERALAAMGVTAEVEIGIEKRLPVQGGMGAGSANAAAALLGLERELGVRLREEERLRVAAAVGSDVPLFLVGGAVLGTGRGEVVTAMPDVGMGEAGDGVACVVAMPRVGVSTPMAFRAWDRLVREGGLPGLTPDTEQLRLKELSFAYSSAFRLTSLEEVQSPGGDAKPDTSGIRHFPSRSGFAPAGSPEQPKESEMTDLAENTLLALVRTGIENDFEEVVFSFHRSLRSTKRLLMGEDSGQSAIYAALSGSGSALFGLYRSTEDARAAQRRVQASGTEALLTETLLRGEYWARMYDEAD